MGGFQTISMVTIIYEAEHNFCADVFNLIKILFFLPLLRLFLCRYIATGNEYVGGS